MIPNVHDVHGRSDPKQAHGYEHCKVEKEEEKTHCRRQRRDPGRPGHPTDVATQVEATSSLLDHAGEPEHDKDDSQPGTEDPQATMEVEVALCNERRWTWIGGRRKCP